MKITSKIIIGLLVVIMNSQVAYSAEGQAQQEPKSFLRSLNNGVEASQRFMVGFLIGASHGALNEGVGYKFVAEGQYVRRNGLHAVTWLGADYLARKYEPLTNIREKTIVKEVERDGRKIRVIHSVKTLDGKLLNDNYKTVLLGRGFGQCLVETVVDNESKWPKLNLSLISSALWYALDYVSSK